jgi:serine/threonine protein phosphatase PrpC
MFRFVTFTDKGPRLENEDALDVLNRGSNYLTACIADGVGGLSCGSEAAQMSVSQFMNELTVNPEWNLKELLLGIDTNIKAKATWKENCNGMATTFTGCIINEYSLIGVHVGDSRLCILRGNGVKQLTESHTELDRLIREGKIERQYASLYPRKHVLESALGTANKLLIQQFSFSLQSLDRVILSTDGFHEIVTKEEQRDLSVKLRDLDELRDSLVKLIKRRKVTDNVSFVIIEIE